MPINHANPHMDNPSGRLTLTSGVPVTTSDVASATTLYYTPYVGNTIQLYDGTRWVTHTFSELSKSLSGVSGYTSVDVWIYSNNGSPTISLTEWTDALTRGYTLGIRDGVYTHPTDPTYRYIGTFGTYTAGETNDKIIQRDVWNMYNKVQRPLYVTEGTNHTYNSATPRLWNNSSTNNLLQVTVGLESKADVTLSSFFNCAQDNNTLTSIVYAYGDNASLFYVLSSSLYANTSLANECEEAILTAGWHTFSAYEAAPATTSTFRRMDISVLLEM